LECSAADRPSRRARPATSSRLCRLCCIEARRQITRFRFICCSEVEALPRCHALPSRKGDDGLRDVHPRQGAESRASGEPVLCDVAIEIHSSPRITGSPCAGDDTGRMEVQTLMFQTRPCRRAFARWPHKNGSPDLGLPVEARSIHHRRARCMRPRVELPGGRKRSQSRGPRPRCSAPLPAQCLYAPRRVPTAGRRNHAKPPSLATLPGILPAKTEKKAFQFNRVGVRRGWVAMRCPAADHAKTAVTCGVPAMSPLKNRGKAFSSCEAGGAGVGFPCALRRIMRNPVTCGATAGPWSPPKTEGKSFSIGEPRPWTAACWVARSTAVLPDHAKPAVRCAGTTGPCPPPKTEEKRFSIV